MSTNVQYGTGVAQLDPKVLRFVEALAKVHGKVSVRKETSGLHAYFPSPLRIPLDGRKELVSMHGALNLDKYFGMGKWEGMLGTYDNDDCCMCMKTGKNGGRISAMDILDYPPIQERGIPEVTASVSVTSIDLDQKRVTDEFGRRVPGSPGDFYFLKDLPPDHPAVAYVVGRGFNLGVLHDMLEAAFCYREFPEGSLHRYFRKGPDGWKDTPQNRLILFGRQHGSVVGWQGRMLQYDKDGYSYFLHPYRNEWVPVEFKAPDGTKQVRPDYGVEWKRLSRYKSADAMERNSVVFCFDAAVRWNQMMAMSIPGWRRKVVVTEGPLDAAKFGPPAVGLTGKFLSPDQARLLAGAFDEATSLMDNDTGGDEAEEGFKETLTYIPARSMRPPKHRKDLGDCSPEEIQYLRSVILAHAQIY